MPTPDAKTRISPNQISTDQQSRTISETPRRSSGIEAAEADGILLNLVEILLNNDGTESSEAGLADVDAKKLVS